MCLYVFVCVCMCLYVFVIVIIEMCLYVFLCVCIRFLLARVAFAGAHFAPISQNAVPYERSLQRPELQVRGAAGLEEALSKGEIRGFETRDEGQTDACKPAGRAAAQSICSCVCPISLLSCVGRSIDSRTRNPRNLNTIRI